MNIAGPLILAFAAAGYSQPVYRVSAAADGPVIAAATLGALVPGPFAGRIVDRRCPCARGGVNRLDRSTIGRRSRAADELSDVTLAAALAAPVAADLFDVGPTEAFVADMVVYSEVLAVSQALTNLSKYSVQRPRPLLYDDPSAGQLSKPDNYTSFYSGHASSVFAALTAASMTRTLRHGSSSGPWLVTLAVGGAVSAQRVLAGKHFISDVLAGAAMGTAVGVGIPYLHARHRAWPWRVEIAPRPAGAVFSLAVPF